MPVKVWKEIVKIQRTFLWGGLSKRNRICWVKWDDFCKPKSEAGLGIRDLRLVNLSLLAKWRWKLLSPDMEVWKDVVVAKYGQEIIGKGNLGDLSIPRLASKWWSGICNLDKDTNWFSEAVEKRVGDGILTYFWNDVWMGNQALRHRFPRIYGISNQKENTIASMGRWEGNMWRWDFHWRRNLFVWEEPIKTDFLELIHQFVPSESRDKWLWRENREHGFSVNECYVMLQQKFSVRRVMDPVDEFVFTKVWKCGAPSKVCAFSWQLLLNRIQTKDNLCKRRILQQQQTNCVLCGLTVENTIHLFLHCACSSRVWYEIMRWLGFVVIIPPNLASS
ncbi:LINE-1 reverse transcriptase like, partial [Trifolium medium]|nr:LINE-1 reverse transcriptase like [Trifolium medium]